MVNKVFRMNTHKVLWVLAVVVLVMTAVGCGKKGKALEVVRKDKITRGNLNITISATGEVKPQNRVEIKPPITGRIDEVLVREGDAVKQGQTLAWMSSTDRAALLDVARSQGPDAMAKWEDSYKAAPLIAPLDGTVILRAVEPGQTVTSSDAVVVLADRLIVEALVDETDLAMVTLKQRVDISLDAYPKDRISAEVDHIAYESRIVNNISMYPVDILPSEVPATFRSGMTATVTFIVAERSDVLLIPSDAVSEWPKGKPRPDQNTFAAYKKKFGGELISVPIHIGESDGNVTELLDGLKEHEDVFVVRRKESGRGQNPFSSPSTQQRRSSQNSSR